METKRSVLAERIEASFDFARTARSDLEHWRQVKEAIEERVKLENTEAYMNAKNGEIRQLLLLSWLHNDEDWQMAREEYRKARHAYRQELLHIERLKLLVEERKANREWEEG